MQAHREPGWRRGKYRPADKHGDPDWVRTPNIKRIPVPESCYLDLPVDESRNKKSYTLGGVAIYAALRGAGFPQYIALPVVYKQARGKSVMGGTKRILENLIKPREAVLKLQRDLGITRDDIIAGMMDAVYASQNAMELLSAWREIGRLVGAYAPRQLKVEHNHSLDLMMREMSALSDAELANLAGPQKLILPPSAQDVEYAEFSEVTKSP